MRLVRRGVLRFGVQAAPKVQRAKGGGWGRELVTGKGEEPRRQGHTPSKRRDGSGQIEDGDASAAVAGWIVLVVGSFGFFVLWLVRHRPGVPGLTAVPRTVADCGERCPRFAILALRAASLSVVLSATQAAHEGLLIP